MEKISGKEKGKENMGCEGYDLRGRDKPKRSWTKSLGFADADADDDDDGTTTNSMLKVQCRACGKEFASMKALFGHMRHHSGRERKGVNCQVCGRKFKYLKALTGHMRLHHVKLGVLGESGFDGSRHELDLENITVRRKRSKRMRYNNAPNSSLISSLNKSSGLVEIDQEEEDVALCLIMLSMGVKDWSEFNSFWGSSDSISEIKSLPQNEEIMQDENGNPYHDGDESFLMNKARVDKSDSDASASVNVFYEKNINESKELGSGVMTDKVKKVGSEAPKDMSCRGVEFMVSKVDDELGFELYENEIEERISGEIMTFRSIEVEPGKDLMEGLELAGFRSTKSSSYNYDMFNACDAEPGGDSLNKLISSPLNSEMSDDSHKKDKYKCRICSKTFKSHQALGGHQTIHRKSNISSDVEEIENCEKITPEIEASCKLVKVDHVENSMDQEMNGLTSYRTRVYKVHECGICLKVFASGQALGGHKRSHILKDPGTSDKQLEFSDISDAIDLNLPVMHNEEANGDIGFKSCRVGNDCKNEALLSLVAN
ncbi:hypothetical protein PTKIN_Ptkin08bG0065500 [Pterospermum kingtungense]